MRLKDIPPHTLITGVAGIAWLGSFVVRAIKPDFALGAAADALMTTVVGYWFTAEHKSGGNDFIVLIPKMHGNFMIVIPSGRENQNLFFFEI